MWWDVICVWRGVVGCNMCVRGVVGCNMWVVGCNMWVEGCGGM